MKTGEEKTALTCGFFLACDRDFSHFIQWCCFGGLLSFISEKIVTTFQFKHFRSLKNHENENAEMLSRCKVATTKCARSTVEEPKAAPKGPKTKIRERIK
jgi:hypothetical protein